MTAEESGALSDAVLSAGTFILALTVGPRRSAKTWKALFICLALASGFGAIYHGLPRFHNKEFWVLVSTTSVASAFLFLSASVTISKPTWKWLGWTWPVMGLGGFLLGGLLGTFPFLYISVISGICLLVSLLILSNSPLRTSRNFIFIGIGLTFLGLGFQQFWGNWAFHYTQLVANFFFWLGARNS